MIKKLAWLIITFAITLPSGDVKAETSVEEVAYFLLSCMSEFKEEPAPDDMMKAFQVTASKQRNFDPLRAEQVILEIRDAIDKDKNEIVYRCTTLTKGILEIRQGRDPIVSQFTKDAVLFLAKRRSEKELEQLPASMPTRLMMSSDPERLKQLLNAPFMQKTLRNAVMTGKMSECLGSGFPLNAYSKILLAKLQILLFRLGEHPNSTNARDILGMPPLLIEQARKAAREKPSLCHDTIRLSKLIDFKTLDDGLKSHIEALNELRKTYGLPPSQ